MKDEFGEDRVLNIATFSTEGTRSALLSACRGMGIDVDEASYLTNLIPSERGRTWTLRECYFGDGDKRKPVKELVDAVNKHEGLMEISLKIDGLIKNKSVHASGVFVYNDPYYKHNAMMRASSGQPTTQFDMKDSEGYLGNLKLDMLTVQNVDKIRSCMDMLIEDDYIEWQGSLRETYNKYLHPKVLEYDNPEMWAMVGENSIPDLFQFDTMVGLQTAQKIKPTNVVELTSANNLMRLMGEGVQPADKYVLFRDNPELWIKEMKEYGLTDEEIEVVKEHLEDVAGVSSSQEEIMLLSMDERIANFSVIEANNLRKAVANIDPIALAEVKENFFKKGHSNNE